MRFSHGFLCVHRGEHAQTDVVAVADMREGDDFVNQPSSFVMIRSSVFGNPLVCVVWVELHVDKVGSPVCCGGICGMGEFQLLLIWCNSSRFLGS